MVRTGDVEHEHNPNTVVWKTRSEHKQRLKLETQISETLQARWEEDRKADRRRCSRRNRKQSAGRKPSTIGEEDWFLSGVAAAQRDGAAAVGLNGGGARDGVCAAAFAVCTKKKRLRVYAFCFFLLFFSFFFV
jgi:hypothetical protein